MQRLKLANYHYADDFACYLNHFSPLNYLFLPIFLLASQLIFTMPFAHAGVSQTTVDKTAADKTNPSAVNPDADNQTPTSLDGKVKQRLKQLEFLNLDASDQSKGISVEQATERMDSQRKALDLTLDSALILNGLSGINNQLSAERMAQEESLQDKTQGIKLSLAEIRAKALIHNLSLKIANMDPLIARTQLDEERAKFDRIIFANLKYGDKDLPAISGDNVKFTSDNPALDDALVKFTKTPIQTKSVYGDIGIAIPLRTGGTITIAAPFENLDKQGDFNSDEYRTGLKFSISQPLLRDAGTAVNEASIQIASVNEQATLATTRLQSIRIIAMIDKAYWALNQAWTELEIRQQQFEYATQNLIMVRKRVQEGLTAAIEINRAEIGVNDRLEQLIIAKTNLNLAQRQLKFYLNDPQYPLANETNFITTTVPDLFNYQFNRDDLVKNAQSNRLDLLETELRLSEDLLRIAVLENQTLPLFSLDYAYGALSDSESSFGRAYNSLNRFDYNEWYIGLRFELPVTNEARRARLSRAVQQRLQRLSTKELQELTIQREIYDVLDRLEQNWQRIVTTKQQVVVAGINYEAELKQFKEGLRTMTEVLEALTRLGDAQVREIDAITDYQASQIDLAFSTGTLLGYSRVNFDRLNFPAH